MSYSSSNNYKVDDMTSSGFVNQTLTLEDGQHHDTVLYRLQKGSNLEFRIGASLFGRKVTLYMNYPDSEEDLFSRKKYSKRKWMGRGSNFDDTLYHTIKIKRDGSFHYYFKCDDDLSVRGSGNVVVDPILRCNKDEVVHLNSVRCITFLSKNLGPFGGWLKKLEVAYQTGYNMIHFTPIQELGDSKSAYSIADQLTINPTFSDELFQKVTMEDVMTLTDKMRTEWKMLSICDIVLNHTANESQWLQEHPECTYNMINSPYLKSAYLLDIALHNFSLEIAKGNWELNGIPELICTEEHLGALRHALLEVVLPKVKIEELYMIPVDTIVSDFLMKCRTSPPRTVSGDSFSQPEIKIIQDSSYGRMKSTIDMTLALAQYNVFRNDCFDEETRIQKCAYDFKAHLESLNSDIKNKIQNHLRAAVDNVVAGVRYDRVDANGPRLKKITAHNPLFTRYFTDYKNEPDERHAYSKNEAAFIMAHNGWVMNADPLKNFADPGSHVYLRRELVAWGDSVKLRYGDTPENCPHLWERMTKYVEETAKVFDGIRLDNCHSTPLHVAEYLLDKARLIRPNLYVLAELFTSSSEMDNLFVNRLGITSLVRESMSAWNSHELGRLVHRFGGKPVGSFFQPDIRPLMPSVAHAVLYDVTHDNHSPIEKRTILDLLPSSALVTMASCSVGSTMGYDLLVPHHIHVVEETRTYPEWGVQVNEKTGIIAAKKALNELHDYLAKNGYDQIYVDQIDGDIVCITRHSSTTHESVIMASYTCFSPNPNASGENKGIDVMGVVEDVLIEAYLCHKSKNRYSVQYEFVKNENYINGLTNYELMMKTNFKAKDVSMVQLKVVSENKTRVNFTENFKPGCIIAIKVVQSPTALEALKTASKFTIEDFTKNVLTDISLENMNRILYSCGGENGEVYTVPNFRPFVYCGLQGIMSFMEEIALNNDLGHPICQNLRDGNWLIDYTVNRLKAYEGTKIFGEWLEKTLNPVKDIPKSLVPCYFYLILSKLYDKLIRRALDEMKTSTILNSNFAGSLALGSVQFGGIVNSSPLPPLSCEMRPPRPKYDRDTLAPLCVSLAAGFPNFSAGYIRNWGRDTFISLRGLFLLTTRYEEARCIILAYAACLRHGLIPNLLFGGFKARYNCRDAVWWWLYTIKHYTIEVPNGVDILSDKVNRMYPTDDSPATSKTQTLHDVIQEAMTKHFQGLCFRERNASFELDAHMKSAGFDNQIGVHPTTGFVFGGNEWNCGTWMDKMGSSDRAGTRGRPATPRDGSAIEIVALCKSVVTWLADVHQQGKYPYEGVTRKNSNGLETSWTFSEWANIIQNNFEKHFWIPVELSENEMLRKDLIHRRGIYKDCFGATKAYTDYQLRCNYSVAMIIAPELFTPENAWTALENAKSLLLGPLGMKTLDPADWEYCGVYNNNDKSENAKTADGFSYHQGPEWLWPVGYFLRARLYFAEKYKDKITFENVYKETRLYLGNHFKHLNENVWRGLPELTNENGAFCYDSCPTQAWSMSSILEAMHDLSQMMEKLDQRVRPDM